jgi:N-acetylmuramoyl-L-alanine amidase
MKLLRICSSVFLIIGLCAIGYAGEHFPFPAQITKESVNIRAGANANFEKVDKVSKGIEIVILGKSFDWYKVQLPKTAKAYIRADYLKLNQNSMAELIGDKVNIRAAANSESTSLGVIQKGDLVKVITQTNGWWQIEPPVQATGWIQQDFLMRLQEPSKSKS